MNGFDEMDNDPYAWGYDPPEIIEAMDAEARRREEEDEQKERDDAENDEVPF